MCLTPVPDAEIIALAYLGELPVLLVVTGASVHQQESSHLSLFQDKQCPCTTLLSIGVHEDLRHNHVVGGRPCCKLVSGSGCKP